MTRRKSCRLPLSRQAYIGWNSHSLMQYSKTPSSQYKIQRLESTNESYPPPIPKKIEGTFALLYSYLYIGDRIGRPSLVAEEGTLPVGTVVQVHRLASSSYLPIQCNTTSVLYRICIIKIPYHLTSRFPVPDQISTILYNYHIESLPNQIRTMP